MPAPALPWKTQKEILQRYMAGENKHSLAKEYKITPKTVENILKTKPNTNTEIEQHLYNTRLKWENDEIMSLKKEHYDIIHTVIDKMKGTTDPIILLRLTDAIQKSMDQLDKQWRLNNEMATDKNVTEKKETKAIIDVSKVMEQLQTPEQKQAFFLNQIKK